MLAGGLYAAELMALAFFAHVCELIQNPLKTQGWIQCTGAESQDTRGELCVEK